MAQNLLAMQETQVRSLGQEDALEKEVTTYSSILWASLIAQLVKNSPIMQQDPGSILGSGRSPGEGIIKGMKENSGLLEMFMGDTYKDLYI